MVFEKKQLSKALAIALMVACAVAFMPLLNGQAFAAAKKPAKVKSLKAAQVADTMTAKATWKKGKNCKKYNVKVDGVLVAKKQKAKSYTTEALTEGAHKIAVAGVNGKKVGKYKTVTVNIVAPTPPTPKLEVTGVVQSGAKQLKVTFSTAVGDVTGYKFTVTRDGKEITATAKADPNDPNSILLDVESTIQDGAKLSVTVATAEGLLIPTAAGASTEVAGETAKVSSIWIDENLILLTDATTNTGATAEVAFAIKNQFGEDVTKANSGSLTVTPAIGTLQSVDYTNGMIYVQGIPQVQAIPGTKGTIVAVYNTTGVNTTAEVTVGAKAKVNAINVKGIYDKKGKEVSIIAGAKIKDKPVKIAYELKDQYGRSFDPAATTQPTLTKTFIAGLTGLDLVKNTAATDYVVSDIEIGEDTFYALTFTTASLDAAKAGNAQLVIVSNETGTKGEYEFTVGNENVIASLSVAAPEQVIGGDKNVFTLEAKNAAGEAITQYSQLKGKISVNGTVLTDTYDNVTDGWALKELKDGTAQLVYKAPASTAAPTPLGYTLGIATFAAVDTPQAVTTQQFQILPGLGIPVGIKSVKVDSYLQASSPTTIYGSKLGKVVYEDVFGNAIPTDKALYVPTGTGADTYKLTITENLPKTMIHASGAVDNISLATGINGLGTTEDAVTAATLDSEHKILAPGETATGKVTVGIYKQAAGATTWSLVADKTVEVTAANNVAPDKYDSYTLKAIPVYSDGILTVDPVVDDVTDVYIPEIKDGAWKAWPATYEGTYALQARGIIDGVEYELGNSYIISDSANLVAGKQTVKTGASTTESMYILNVKGTAPSSALVKGATEDVITLDVADKAGAAVKTVAFGTDEQVVTSMDAEKDYELDNFPIAFSNNSIGHADVGQTLPTRDQYLNLFQDDPSVKLISVTNAGGASIPAKNDDTGDVNWTNPYTGKNFVMTRTSASTVPAGSFIEVEADYGTFVASVEFVVADPPVLSDLKIVAKSLTVGTSSGATTPLTVADAKGQITGKDQYGNTIALPEGYAVTFTGVERTDTYGDTYANLDETNNQVNFTGHSYYSGEAHYNVTFTTDALEGTFTLPVVVRN